MLARSQHLDTNPWVVNLLLSDPNFEAALHQVEGIDPNLYRFLIEELMDILERQNGAIIRSYVTERAAFQQLTEFIEVLGHGSTFRLFSLNYDCLIEYPYLIQREQLGTASRTPGQDYLKFDATDFELVNGSGRLVPSEIPECRQGNVHHVHGAWHWRTKDGSSTVITGQQKIDKLESGFLRGCLEAIGESLAAGGDLVVVGYSFSDPHVNQQLSTAVRSGTRIHVIESIPSHVWMSTEHAGLDPRFKKITRSYFGVGFKEFLQSHLTPFRTMLRRLQNVGG